MKKTRKEKGEEEVEKKEEEKKLLNEPEKNVSNLQVVPEETPIRGRDSFSAQRAHASHLWPSPLPPGQNRNIANSPLQMGSRGGSAWTITLSLPCGLEASATANRPHQMGSRGAKCKDGHPVLIVCLRDVSHGLKEKRIQGTA